MKKQIVNINPEGFPYEIQAFLKNVNAYDSSCSSSASVYYLDSGLYLKVDTKGSLKKEAELAQHFFKKGLGIELIAYLSDDKDYMITRSAVGKDATHYLKDPEKLCAVIAQALHTLHTRTSEAMPVSSRMQRYIDSVETLQDRNFDKSVLLERFGINSKQEAIQIIQENKCRLKLNTLIHGDACLPNIILDNYGFSSFIDFNLAGLGDKHADLYWVCWSLNYNLKSEGYIDCFLDAYGRDNFDYDMLKIIAAFESIE